MADQAPPQEPPQPGQPIPVPPGQQLPPGMRMPTPEEIEQMRARIAADAQKAGMSVPEFVEKLKMQQMARQAVMMRQQQQQQQAQQSHDGHDHDHGHQPTTPTTPMAPGPGGAANPKALALAAFLRSQDLKLRTSILNGERKDMFRVKRAMRVLMSPAYERACLKNPLLPEITDRPSCENAFKLLPLSMLAIRVSKADPHHGHNHGPGGHQGKQPKRTKGLWTIKIEPQQDVEDDMYYVWLWEGSQLKAKLYAALALALIFVVVCYPLWPASMRQGVYHLTWGLLIFMGLFFAMAIFRVILFCVTYFVLSPGLWLFPNLWEDVSVIDSFKPVWGWHETAPKKKKKRSKSITAGTVAAQNILGAGTGQPAAATATTTATETTVATGVKRTYSAPKVEDLIEED